MPAGYNGGYTLAEDLFSRLFPRPNQGLSTTTPPVAGQAEPMGNSIRRLVNDARGTALPMTQYAPLGPFATIDDHIAYEKRRWRDTAPTALFFTPGMSFDGIRKLNTPEEYEAYKDQVATKSAWNLYDYDNNRILPGAHSAGWRRH